MQVYCKPNGSTVGMSAARISGTGVLTEYTASTDLPASTQGLLPIVWANNGTTAAVIDPCLVGLYIETDL